MKMRPPRVCGAASSFRVSPAGGRPPTRRRGLFLAVERAGDAHLQAAQLRQTAHAAVARVARVRAAVQVVAHLVSVVGAHRNRDLALLLDLEQRLHHLVHRHVAFEVVVFLEVAVGVAARRAQVHEAHAILEFTHHGRQVVVGAHTERSGAEAEAVRTVGHGGDQLAEVLGGGEDARQSENRVGGIVGVDDQFGPHLVGYGADLAQEGDEVAAQRLGIDPLVAVERLAELLDREALLGSRQPGDHVARDELLLGLVHRLEAGPGPGDLFGRVLREGGLALQDEEVEGHEGGPLEAQRLRTVLDRVGEVRARPVEHGHEVVGDAPDAARREVADRLLVVLEVLPVFAFARLDVLVDGNTLDDRPDEPRLGDHRLPFADLLDGPDLAVRNMMQGVDDVRGPRLADVREGDGIVRPVPAPGLFAKIHGVRF